LEEISPPPVLVPAWVSVDARTSAVVRCGRREGVVVAEHRRSAESPLGATRVAMEETKVRDKEWIPDVIGRCHA